MNRSYSQEEMTQIVWWLKVIIDAPENEFIERYTELTEILPMAIIGIARKKLSPVAIKKFDRLTDYSFCEIRKS